jgi:uncharacterized protein DUF4232
VVVSGVGAALAFFDVLPVSLVQLALPSGTSGAAWSGVVTATVVVPVASGLLVGALVATAVLLVRRSAARRDARPPFATWWLAVALAAVAAALGSGLGELLVAWPPPRLRMLLDPLPPFLQGAALWGVVWGWLPALVARRLDAHDVRGSRSRIAPAVVLPLAALALAAALVAPMLKVAPPEVAAAPTATPAPTRDGPAVPAVAPGSHAVPAAWCSDDQVQVGLGGGDAATGHRVESLTVTNTTGVDCSLRGYPDVVFADATDALLPVHLVPGGSFMTKDPGPTTVLLHPGQRAVSELGWDGQPNDPGNTARYVHLAAYPGAERAALPFVGDIVRGCSVGVTAWRPASPADAVSD